MTYQPVRGSGNALPFVARVALRLGLNLSYLEAPVIAFRRGEPLRSNSENVQEVDPVVTAYSQWLAARREWWRWAKVEGNGNFDRPESLAAEAAENAAEAMMLAQSPTTKEGVAALVALAWFHESDACHEPFDPDSPVVLDRVLLSIWRACGQDGQPITK